MKKEVWYCPSAYILRISDKCKPQTTVQRKKKERQKRKEWKEREKTKQASSFGKPEARVECL